MTHKMKHVLVVLLRGTFLLAVDLFRKFLTLRINTMKYI